MDSDELSFKQRVSILNGSIVWQGAEVLVCRDPEDSWPTSILNSFNVGDYFDVSFRYELALDPE
jgi:hypothetical protein